MVKSDTKKKEHLDELVNNCLIFTDRNGRVLDKAGSPVSARLEMEYSQDDIYIHFRVQQSPYGNGSLSLKVKVEDVVVLQATGNYIGRPCGIVAKTYKPGSWEKLIPKYKV